MLGIDSQSSSRNTGPLGGIKVVELAGLGPVSHACMMLADLGADVIRVDRPGGMELNGGSRDLLNRGRPSVALDLKRPEGIEAVLRLVESADAIIEGMRPGALERLGLAPDVLHSRNQRLVIGRMTGWGQTGPYSQSAGHDMNYIAITGALHGLGQDTERPHFPGNLVGDFGGGSMYLVAGVLAGLLESRSSGRGQVVDAAIVDGTAHLNAMTTSFLVNETYREERATNLLDGGVPYYDIYETSDGQHMSVAAIEKHFYSRFISLLGIADRAPDQHDSSRHDELRALIEEAFKTRTQAEWIEIFEGTDACVAGIIPISQAVDHPHMAARQVFIEHGGQMQPAPAPRFSRTPATLGNPPVGPGANTREALEAWGIVDVDDLIAAGVAVEAP